MVHHFICRKDTVNARPVWVPSALCVVEPGSVVMPLTT